MPKKGYKQTEEHKRKRSKVLLGRIFSEETLEKMSKANMGEKNPNFGKKHTKETKRKISQALKGENNPMFGITGKNHPMFGRINNKHPNYSKKLSEETKQKISESKKGRKHTIETCQKISKGKRGKYCGKDSHMWRGGTSLEPYCFEFTKDLKEFIKQRDNYKCMTPFCEKPITRNNPLGVHHIDYDKKNCTFENLISNCRSCNCKANFNRDEWKEIYRTVIKQNYEY